jgi:chemotaxis protein methyltransferase CheR
VIDLPLNDDLYDLLRDLLRNRLGLHFPPHRRADVAHAMTLVAHEHGFTDLNRLYTALIAGGPIWDAAIRRLTIGETYFFRNGAQFLALREWILPDLIAQRAGARSLRFWSAGCASGEEPYSLAMTLADTLPAESGWQISVLGTDLNLEFLDRARQAIYGQWSFRETTEEQRTRFFSPEGGRWRLRPEIRRTVMFNRINLASDEYPALVNGTMAMDVIFCRNVLIYFDEATIRAVAKRLYAALAPGGWLVVGHAEPNARIFYDFETVNTPGTVLYRKPADAPLFTVSMPSPFIPLRPPAAPLPLPTSPRHAATLIPQPPPIPSPLPPPPDPLVAARVATNAGDWKRATELVNQALIITPMRAAAHFIRGQIYEHVGQVDEAIAAYRRSLYLDPAFVMGNLAIADMWRREGQIIEARRGYRSALRLLDQLDPTTLVPESDGTRAVELRAYVNSQMKLLGD